MPSLARLFVVAHPNSALRRKHPTGCHASDLPGWHNDTTDPDHRTNTGFPDDYAPNDTDAHGDRWAANAYWQDDSAAVLYDLGANLPPGNPFATAAVPRG